MDVFALRERLISDYQSFARSFTTIHADDLKKGVDDKYSSGKFWPEPLVQINPRYAPGRSTSDLAVQGVLLPLTAQCFDIPLYKHQENSVALATSKQSYVVTTGTGSGKSVCFFLPIADAILRARQQDATPRTRAIVIYPMNALADYSVCTTWGVKGKSSYLLHVLRKRMAYPELKKMVLSQAELWNANVVLIEDKASGTQLIQELRQINYRVKGVKPEGDKLMRMVAQTPAIEAGRVLLPKQASWLGEYVHELTTFPKGKYDDQVDSTAQALKWIGKEGQTPGLIQYYRDECERLGIRPPGRE